MKVVNTRIILIPDENVVLESFKVLKDFVDSVLQDKIRSCQLLYEPS